MPSGHSMVAMEFLVWVFLETLFPHRRSRNEFQFSEPIVRVQTGNFVVRFVHNLTDLLVKKKARYNLLFWAIVILLPVPISRVVLNYHTVEQAIIGVLLGTVFGVLWFVLLAMIATPRGWTKSFFSESATARRLRVKHTYRCHS